MLIGQALLKQNHSSEWTNELQKEYDLKMIEIKKPILEHGERGLPKKVYLTPEHPKYPKRILELNKIRKRAFGDFPITISKNGGIALTDNAIAETFQEENNLNKVK